MLLFCFIPVVFEISVLKCFAFHSQKPLFISNVFSCVVYNFGGYMLHNIAILKHWGDGCAAL